MNCCWRKLLFRASITLGLTALLFQFRLLIPMGADGPYMATLVENQTLPMFYRSLLTLWLHRLFFVTLEPFGWNASDAISLGSAFAGAIAIQTLWAIRSHPGFLAFNVLSGCFLVFAGHVENYHWVNLFLLLTFLWVKRWLDGQAPLWPAMAWYMTAALSHMLALFYLPAMLYVWHRRRKQFHPAEVLVPFIAFLAVVLVSTFSRSLGGTEITLERFVPLFTAWAPNHHFTFLSKEHIVMLFYFHHHAAFLGVPFELPLLGYLVWRRRVTTIYHKFLLCNVICGLAWTTVWHPDWGPMDWDLFSQFAIPLHVMLGLLLWPEPDSSKVNASS